MLDSLFRRKENEQRFAQEGRLPPGPVGNAEIPGAALWPGADLQPGHLDLRVWGEVEQEAALDLG